MIRTTTCPMCDNPNCYLVEFPNGTKRYRCDKCDCYYTPAWLMDENLRVLRTQNEESKGENDAYYAEKRAEEDNVNCGMVTNFRLLGDL